MRQFFYTVFVGVMTFMVGPALSLVALHEEVMEDFSLRSYSQSTEECFKILEKEKPELFQKNPKGAVGIKVSTIAGEGLHTPHALVRAVIKALKKRGYDENQIFLWDRSESKLRVSGFLPKLSERAPPCFDGCGVKTLQNPAATDPEWFYESRIAPAVHYSPRYVHAVDSYENVKEARRSYLPVELFLDVDFWIHLPVAMEHPHLGPWCALADSSFGMITNMERFFNAPTHMPIACAEINCIPELYEKHACTLLSLEQAQCVGGLNFYPRFGLQQKKIWYSSDPLAIDSAWTDLLNQYRVKKGFAAYTSPLLFDYINRMR